MDETLRKGLNETERQPIEIGFGAVVQFFDTDKLAPEQFVVVDPASERTIGVCEILDDGSLAGDSSENRRATIIGNWHLDQIVHGRLLHNAPNPEGQEAIYRRDYSLQSQKPPVQYVGRIEA